MRKDDVFKEQQSGRMRTRGRKQKRFQRIAAVMAAAMLIPANAQVYASARSIGMVYGEETAKSGWMQSSRAATGSEAESIAATDSNMATASVALMQSYEVSSLGDLWDGWNGDFSFLDGKSGIGTKDKPYQIKNKSQLMGLSQLAAMGMRVDPGEGVSEVIGSYDGCWFKLVNSIDLGGMDWNPIGFYRDTSEFSGEVTHKFFGNFDGNGKTISNFRLNRPECGSIGFFGAVEDAVIENLTLRPGKSVCGKTSVGILAGNAVNSRVAGCSVSGNISAAGNAGGIAGEISGSDKTDSVIENCSAAVTIDANGAAAVYAGGIAGKAANSSIVDCEVSTGDNHTARIQGKGTVGGIAGLQNHTDIYNVIVRGTVGGTGSKVIGGITGEYVSGRLKTARFEGTIGQSNMGVSGRRGTFIGNREAGNYYRFGEDVAYLFTDSESKIAFGVCGSGIDDDNEYTYGAHIGFSHGSDLFYTLIQGGISKTVTDTYYYEELENGILSIQDRDHGGAGKEELGYEIDHFAPDDAGRPARGYLITVPQIDTVSSGTYYYDVAVLEARGTSAYCRTINKERRGAVAAGKTVMVTTSAKNTENEKFQMEGMPTYMEGEKEKEMEYVTGGSYTFTMPDENTQVKAVYKKVAVTVTTVPSSCNLSVMEERTGNRKNPVKTTKVLDMNGKLIATYINGELEEGTKIQPITIQAVVDRNNDVADSSVKWSVDDHDLIQLLANDDEDAAGYTKKSASLRLNLNSAFFTDIIRKLEKEQAENGYRYPIPDTIYGSGYQNGGVAVLTASTRPAASFEEKPCTGNCRINVTYQIKDKTYVANEGASLDKAELVFTVTRRLSGNRKMPQEELIVTPPQSISASFTPDFFDKKDVRWITDDAALLTVDGENKSAVAAARKDSKWIQDIIAADTGIHENNPYAALNGAGEKMAKITVIGNDMLGNRQTADCHVRIRFVTEDNTKIYVESVETEPKNLVYKLSCIKSGNRRNPQLSWSGNEMQTIKTIILPEQAFDKNCRFIVNDDSLTITEDGKISVNTNAEWIQDADRTRPYVSTHTANITAVTEDGGHQAVCSVLMSYKMTDNTYTSGRGNGGSGGSGSSGGSASSGSGISFASVSAGGTGPAAGGTSTDKGIRGTWTNKGEGLWTFSSEGRTYRNEWAYIYNPYAKGGQGSTDWFRFDEAGVMVTGWFTDADGHIYYLWTRPDGTQGSMLTGWQWLPGTDGLERRYYFNPEPDGTKGALFRNATLPDGSQVNENGEWTVNGIVQTGGFIQGQREN